MKTKFLSFLVFCAVLLGACAPRFRTMDKSMGILFSNSTTEKIGYGALPAVMNVPLKSVLVSLYFTSLPANNQVIWTLDPVGASDERFTLFYVSGSGKMQITIGWSGTSGDWTFAPPSTGAFHEILITYDNSSTANNPVVYIDGSPVSVTRAVGPTGSYKTGANVNWVLGSDVPTGGSSRSINGIVFSWLFYNVILSSQEATDGWNSRLVIPTYRGLKFAPLLYAAKGLTIFDGAVLAAGNTLLDEVGLAVGVPAGSPVGASDSYLNIGK